MTTTLQADLLEQATAASGKVGFVSVVLNIRVFLSYTEMEFYYQFINSIITFYEIIACCRNRNFN